MRNLARCHGALIALSVFGMASGCGALKEGYQPKQLYAFELNRPDATAAPADKGVVKVRRFRVSSAFQDKQLVYRTGDVTYESDFYNEFLTSPDALITEEARRWLGASDVFAAALDASSRVRADYALEGNVLGLYGDYRDRANPRAAVEAQFFLIAEAPVAGAIVFRKTYRAFGSVREKGADGVVSGLNDALTEILASLEADLRDALRKSVTEE